MSEIISIVRNGTLNPDAADAFEYLARWHSGLAPAVLLKIAGEMYCAVNRAERALGRRLTETESSQFFAQIQRLNGVPEHTIEPPEQRQH